jgi:hypothetical protein
MIEAGAPETNVDVWGSGYHVIIRCQGVFSHLPCTACTIKATPDSTHNREGVARDRFLFSETGADPRTFSVHPHPQDAASCIVNGAGSPLGIKVGAVFELWYEPQGQEPGSVLGTAVVTEVEQKRSVARLPPNVALPSDGNVRASLSKVSDPVKVAVTNLVPDSEVATRAHDLLLDRLSIKSPRHFMLVPAAEADLVLRVNERHVQFHRQDIHLGSLRTPDPLLRNADIPKAFPGALARIAHFNYCVSLEGSSAVVHPLADDVSLHLHRLAQPAMDYDADDFTFSDVYLDPAPDGEVPFVDDEATIQHEGEEELYALIMKNNGQHRLHTYVLLLDPSTYGIELFAQPMNADEPVLPPGGQVQIGRSAACEGALWFDVGPDGSQDTGLLKIVLATEGDLNLKHMAQEPVLGYHTDSDEVNYVEGRQVSRADETVRPMKGKSFLSI